MWRLYLCFGTALYSCKNVNSCKNEVKLTRTSLDTNSCAAVWTHSNFSVYNSSNIQSKVLSLSSSPSIADEVSGSAYLAATGKWICRDLELGKSKSPKWTFDLIQVWAVTILPTLLGAEFKVAQTFEESKLLQSSVLKSYVVGTLNY